MKINRRQFIQITGLAIGELVTEGVISGLPALAQSFEFIPPGEQTFLPINGIFADPSSILDKGVHLRWSLPPSKGIPDLINIFRRRSEGNSGSIKINPANSGLAQLPSLYRNLTFDGSTTYFSLTQTSYGKCYGIKSIDPSKKIRIIFSENIFLCTIQLGQVSKSKIRIFYPDNTLSHEFIAENTSNFSPITIAAQNGRHFKSIEIQLNFSYLYSIEFIGNQYLCDSKGWELVGKIDNTNDLKKGNLINRISVTTKNHYIKSAQDRDRYLTIAKNYWGLMNVLQSPNEDFFQSNDNYSSIAAIPFEKLIIRSKNSSAGSLNAYNLLMLGCIDPNIARLAGLYFVDSEAKTPNELFDYKVEANYNNNYFRKSICGVILNIGGRYSEQSKLNEPLITTQINATRWEFDNEYDAKHLGKVRLAWRAINQNPNNESWKRYIDPVVYSLKIDSNPAKLIAPRIDERNFYFIDQNARVAETEVKYQLTAIDIFGQESNILREKIRLKDNDIPACPVRLNFNQLNDKILLNFEYGGFQYLTDPEISKLDIYFKNDSIYTQNVKIKYNSFSEEGRNGEGNRLVAINLEQAINLETRFYALHFIETISGVKLPAAKRKKFKVVEQRQNKVLILLENEDNFVPESNGIVLLEADPRSKNSTWTKSNDSLIQFKKPIQAKLLNYNHFVSESKDLTHFTSSQNIRTENSFKVLITNVQHKKYSDNVDLFNPEPILEADDKFTEITIDRTLNESDIFTGGKLKFQQSIYTVASQNAGYGTSVVDEPKTKLTVKDHIPVSQGTALLIPPEIKTSGNGYISNHMVLLLSLSSSEDLKKVNVGEFMFRGTKANLITKMDENNLETITSKEDTLHIIATLMSDIYKHQNQWQVLVRIATKSSFLHTVVSEERSNKVLYFEPYRFNVTNKINSIQLQAKDAFKNVYFTANAIDKSGNESPLSVIAQFIKTRNKDDKPLSPSQPYPCDNPNETEAYLKLPNSEGISYFKVCWNGSSDYRYEVGRALDKSIVVSHRDLWLKGLSYSSDNEQSLLSITLSSISELNSTNGTVEVSLTTTDPNIYIGGRLFQVSSADEKYFEIVKISTEPNNRFKLLLRPMKKGEVPSNDVDCTIQKLPNYKAILEDDLILKQLANLAPTENLPHIPDGLGAFNVVTGQPLRDELSFLDEVPGLGSSRFFYKVRAVDGSENRSLWSGASVPVRQVDTRVPDAPIITYIEGQEQAAYLKWKNENDPKIIGYNLYRTDKKVNPNTVDDYQTERLIKTFKKVSFSGNEILAGYSKIRHKYNQIELPPNPLLNADNIISAIYKTGSNTLPDATINYLIREPTSIHGNIIQHFHPVINNDVQVVVVFNNLAMDGEIILYKNMEENLKTANGQIHLPENIHYNILNSIKGIFKAEEYNIKESVDKQIAENYKYATVTNLLNLSVLKNLYSGLLQNETVAIQITKPNNQARYLTEDEREFEDSDDLKGSLTLDLFYNYRIEAIKEIQITPKVKIVSAKSSEALVQIKMNKLPPVPYIISIKWWDWERNIVLDNITTTSGLQVIIRNFIEQFSLEIFQSGNINGPFIKVGDNNIKKFIINNLVNQIVVKACNRNEIFLKLVYTNYWGSKSSIILRK